MTQALILGVLQGLTEFLPISSSGHLVVAQILLGVQSPGVSLEIVVHVATLLPVVLLLWPRVRGLFVFQGPVQDWPLTAVIVGTIPAAVLGLLFQHPLEQTFETLSGVRVFFLVNAGILALSRIRKPTGRPLTLRIAFLIGLAQCLALLPGISRSGSTITAGLLLGLAPLEAFSFSFLLLLPAVLGAVILKLAEGTLLLTATEGIAFIAAFLSGLLALAWLRRVVIGEKLHWFGLYTLVLGLLLFFL